MHFPIKFLQKSIFPLSGMALISLTLLFVLPSCARKADEPPMFTGATISQVQLRDIVGWDTHIGKANYAVVNRAWLSWHYEDFRQEIGKGQFGVLKWDKLFQCTAFTTRFAADAQLHFRARAWHDDIQNRADSIAIGEFWFLPSGPGAPGHAIIQCVTQNGREFFEPQTGNWLNLTPEQIAGTLMKKFD